MSNTQTIGGVTPFLDGMSNREVLAWLGTFPRMDAWEQEQVISSLSKRLQAAEDSSSEPVHCEYCDTELTCPVCTDESDD